MLPLVERAARGGWRVYILGGAPGVGERAAKRLTERYPGIVIAGTDSPRIDMDAARIVSCSRRRTRSRRRRPIWCSWRSGLRSKSFFIAEAAPDLRPAVLLGIGAAVDFVAGTATRAPRWISDAGLEWLFRLAQEPRRMWRRYLLRDPAFLFIVLRDLRRSLARPVKVTRFVLFERGQLDLPEGRRDRGPFDLPPLDESPLRMSATTAAKTPTSSPPTRPAMTTSNPFGFDGFFG